MKSLRARYRLAAAMGICLVAVLAAPAQAMEWFVSPDGNSANTGASTTSPWSIDYALSDLHNTQVKPGDTIWITAGDYYAVNPADCRIQVNRQGTQAAPILIRNFQNDRVTIHAFLDCGFSTWINTQWVTLWGLELQVRSTTNANATGKGFEVGSSSLPAQATAGIKIVNCIVHDCVGGGFGDWGSASDHQTNGNIVYYNGYDDPNTRGHGHGFYVQSKGPAGHGQLHKDNIVFRNFAIGTQLYGTSAANRDYVTYDGDVFFNDGEISHVSGMVSEMWLDGDQTAQSPCAFNINTYIPGTAGGYVVVDQSNNPQVTNGYFVCTGTPFTLSVNTGLVMTNNTFIGNIAGFTINQYGSGNVLIPARPTSGKRIVVRKNDWDAGRANIVIYNWDKSPTVTVDVSSLNLPVNTPYQVRDAQNYYGAPVATGLYTGVPITLPMTGLTVAAPMALDASYTTPPHTAPEFAVFVLIANINRAPRVNAGQDQTLRLPNTVATLTGAVNDDGQPHGAALSWSWSQVSGPGTVSIANPTSLTTPVTLPAIAGSYVLRLTASDTLLTAMDDVTITLVSNTAPAVNAGPDQSTRIPGAAVTLAGTVSDDGLPLGAAVTWSWSQVSGPGTATIASPASLTTNVSFPAVVGTYVLRLTASDTALSAHDDVNVYVRGGAAVMNLHLPLDEGAGTLAADTSGNGHNGALTSTAWTTGAIGGGVHFDGNSSYIRVSNFAFGPEFSIAFWFKPEGLDTDGGYHYLFSWGGVTSPNDVTVWFTTALEGGIGKAVRTSAQDNDDSSPATPVMDVHDPNEAVFSDGAWHHYCLTVAKDSGRTVFVDGIAKLNDHLGGGDSIAPTTDLFLGGRSDLDPARFYKGSLDDVRVYTGALTDAEVQALVAPGINRPPTANAGADRSIMLPYAAALAGTVSDDGRPGPGACTARWSMISGPGTVAFADANAAATSATFSLPGAYVLRLTASDSILSATDDVTITVKAAGDFNGDGNVNGQDFLIWQTHYPTLCGATTDTGDANGDGMVNGQDFLIWQANYKPM